MISEASSVICEYTTNEKNTDYPYSILCNILVIIHVKFRYLELGYLEFCETQSGYLNQKYILVAFSSHNLALGTFLQVQITRSANQFALQVI